MKTSLEQFEKWLNKRQEDIDLEFKEAASKFGKGQGSLFDYCAAIANGNGGTLILGVRERPRAVLGTQYSIGTHTQLSQEIWDRLKIHIDVEEFDYHGKRVLIFHIPKHSAATRVKSGGKGDKYTFPIRRGESLGEMDDQKTREILNENQPDFTAGIVDGMSFDELDKEAIKFLKQKWAEKTNRKAYLSFDDEKVLKNVGLMNANGITRAGLILVGKIDALQKYLPDAEIVFEWRHNHTQTHYDFRKNWRAPFVSICFY